MGAKCYAVECFVNGEENPQIAPSPSDFVILPEKDRATAIGNMHKKLGNNRACGSGRILADRRTHRHTEARSSQYFATAPAGEMMIDQLSLISILRHAHITVSHNSRHLSCHHAPSKHLVRFFSPTTTNI